MRNQQFARQYEFSTWDVAVRMGSKRFRPFQRRKQIGYARVSIWLFAIAGCLLLQSVAGRLMLWHECGNEPRTILSPPQQAVSIALKHDVSDDPTFNRCGELCFRGLLHPTGRMQFLEKFVETPDPDTLSDQRGWYRYEVLETGDKRCELFVKSKSARKEFDEVARAYFGPSVQSGKRCVGATRTEQPTSKLIRESRSIHWKNTFFGVVVNYMELRDIPSGFVHAKRKHVIYRGSFLYLMATAIYVDGRSLAVCHDEPLVGLTPKQNESFSVVSNLPPIAF